MNELKSKAAAVLQLRIRDILREVVEDRRLSPTVIGELHAIGVLSDILGLTWSEDEPATMPTS